MKKPEYIEGSQATRNFEECMKSLFKGSKAAVVKPERNTEEASCFSRPECTHHNRPAFIDARYLHP